MVTVQLISVDLPSLVGLTIVTLLAIDASVMKVFLLSFSSPVIELTPLIGVTELRVVPVLSDKSLLSRPVSVSSPTQDEKAE